jgi:hypothetical protein
MLLSPRSIFFPNTAWLNGLACISDSSTWNWLMVSPNDSS